MEETQTIKQKVQQIFVELMPDVTKEELGDESDFFSLGLDSINITMFVWKLEEAFDIELKANEISYENFRTIANTIELIRTKLSLERTSGKNNG